MRMQHIRTSYVTVV